MEKSVELFRGLCLSLVFFVAFSMTAFAGGVVAKVAGVPITVHEMQREIDMLIPLNTSYHSGISKEKLEEVRKKAFDTLVDRALKFRYAIDNEIAIDSKQYAAAFDQIRKQYKTEKEFIKALGSETVSELKASLYRKMTAEKVDQVAIADNVKITDDEIKAFYEENKSTYAMPKQFRASHILVKVDPSSNKEELEELETKAESLLARARSGEDFYDLAYYNSDDRSKFVGGDLKYFHEGRTVKEFESALQKMKIGDISDLVRTRFGFHIIKLTDIKEAKQLSFDDMKATIKSQLESKRADELMTKLMDSLRAQYPVEMMGGENSASK